MKVKTRKARAPAIAELAQRVRTLYNQIRNHRLKETGQLQYRHTGRNRDEKIWFKIGELLYDEKIEPENYLSLVISDRGSLPLPNHLLSREFLERYWENSQASDEAIPLLFSNQKQVVLRRLQDVQELGAALGETYTRRELQKAILYDMNLEITPLFRYCLAVAERLPRAMRTFRTEAVRQYLVNPAAYNSAWGKWIPQELRALAGEVDDE